ncbi:MAG: hypothetical protein C4K58_05820 [Flavobacteriaceae bacterium]|nr:MAG: hypothetical protein C4K58_05820 [Flavobacteriaceae bacterium]
MKKHYLLWVSLLFLNLPLAFGQFRINRNKPIYQTGRIDETFDWGFSLGLNSLDYKLNPTTIGMSNGVSQTVYSDAEMGFTVGVLGIYKLSPSFNIQLEPSVHFLSRTLVFDHIPESPERVLKSTYIDVPLFLQYHGERWMNSRPYVQAGASYIRNIQSNEQKSEDISTGTFRSTTNNFSAQFEIGTTFYFEYFRLTPAIRYIYVLNNEKIDDNPSTGNQWMGSIDELQTRGIAIILKFQ